MFMINSLRICFKKFPNTYQKNRNMPVTIHFKGGVNRNTPSNNVVFRLNNLAVGEWKQLQLQKALQDHGVYCASKASVDALTKVMALEWGPSGIRVNSVNPTVVMTDLGQQVWADPEKRKKLIQRIPLGRFAEVDEVVSTVVFLLSDEAASITGSSIRIDGGFEID